jgi:hypothetical protein
MAKKTATKKALKYPHIADPYRGKQFEHAQGAQSNNIGVGREQRTQPSITFHHRLQRFKHLIRGEQTREIGRCMAKSLR